ncbi:MAG: macro domain-containing protein [Nitriliruptor sp.]|uniref:macro domain-containing protein n=1 Tax=Nitriliruptor sp. TaxID=2448056 RepID=UPI0034A0AAA3
MYTYDVSGVRIELSRGDIASQPGIDAVVNAANAALEIGGGVAGALHRAAGPGLAEECRPMAPIAPGECVLSGGHELPNRAVIHCLGPVFGQDEPAEALLASCYRTALEIADASELTSVAFPAISTGAFAYPVRDAADVASGTVIAMAPHLQTVRLVRFVLRTADDLEVRREAFEAASR